jgi:hypothetical protein
VTEIRREEKLMMGRECTAGISLRALSFYNYRIRCEPGRIHTYERERSVQA